MILARARSASWLEIRRPLWQVLLVVALSLVFLEGFWRIAYRVSSPAVGFLLLPIAWGTGRLVQRASARGRAEWTAPETVVLGVLVLAGVFLLLSRFGLAGRVFPVVACALAGLGAKPRLRERLRRPVYLHRLLPSLFTMALAVRCAYFIDRLPLTKDHPSMFSWIDTPFWLSIAYAVERGFPPPDPLFYNATLGYHFGCGAPVAMVRALTGLPMHLAYFSVLVSVLTLLPLLLLRVCRVLLGVSARNADSLAWPISFLVIGAAQHFAWAFPTTTALPILLFVVLRLASVESWKDGLPVILGFAALVVTKEVHYVLAASLCGVLAVHAWVHRRGPRRAIVLGLAFAVSRPLHALAVSVDQKAHLGVFGEHLSLDWIVGELVREHGYYQAPPGSALRWGAMGIITLLMVVAIPRRDERRRRSSPAWFVGAALATYGVGFVLSFAIKPTFVPEMDPFSYGWILGDMSQFETSSRVLLLVALVVVGLATWVRAGAPAITRLAMPGLAVVCFLFPLLHPWKSTSPSLSNLRPEERGEDPIVPLISRLDPATSVIATDHLNWNFENPHWAAFFGHRFFQLRRGRWATATPGFPRAVEQQRRLLSDAPREEAMAIVAATGITHVVLETTRPLPDWLVGEVPLAKNEAYTLFDVRRLVLR